MIKAQPALVKRQKARGVSSNMTWARKAREKDKDQEAQFSETIRLKGNMLERR